MASCSVLPSIHTLLSAPALISLAEPHLLSLSNVLPGEIADMLHGGTFWNDYVNVVRKTDIWLGSHGLAQSEARGIGRVFQHRLAGLQPLRAHGAGDHANHIAGGFLDSLNLVLDAVRVQFDGGKAAGDNIVENADDGDLGKVL